MGKEDQIRILNEMQTKRCTPEMITSLKPNEVFVFGTNPEGEHKSMAAKLAVEKFGAKMGEGEGLFGQSYAIPVHKHRTEKMEQAVFRFVEFAKSHPEFVFYVLPIGCGAAGMEVNLVAPMFKLSVGLDNVYLPMDFIEALKKTIADSISSYRYHGRWYGLMLCLGEQSGRDMEEKLKDKASEVLTMLQISNEFPDDFKYVNQLLALEKAKEQTQENLTKDEIQRDYILGAIEAKKVYLDNRKWERLLVDGDVV